MSKVCVVVSHTANFYFNWNSVFAFCSRYFARHTNRLIQWHIQACNIYFEHGKECFHRHHSILLRKSFGSLPWMVHLLALQPLDHLILNLRGKMKATFWSRNWRGKWIWKTTRYEQITLIWIFCFVAYFLLLSKRTDHVSIKKGIRPVLVLVHLHLEIMA